MLSEFRHGLIGLVFVSLVLQLQLYLLFYMLLPALTNHCLKMFIATVLIFPTYLFILERKHKHTRKVSFRWMIVMFLFVGNCLNEITLVVAHISNV